MLLTWFGTSGSAQTTSRAAAAAATARHVAASPSVRQEPPVLGAAPARAPGAGRGAVLSRRPDLQKRRPLYRYSARARRGPSIRGFFAQRGLEGVAAAARVHQHLNAGRGLVGCFKCLGSSKDDNP